MSKIQPEKTLRGILSKTNQDRSDQAVITRVFYEARVIDINDPLRSRRIKARIDGIDSKYSDSEIEWCQSLTPPYFYCVPQVGELVLVFLQNPWNRSLGRFYFGPIMSGNYTDGETYEETIKNYDKNLKGTY